MAHLAQLGSQTDELVAAVLSPTEVAAHRRIALRDWSLHAIRQHNFGRTNQFEIHEKIQGLEERLRVVGREALADALKKRLDAFEAHKTKWTPEILHFLLELSDQPAQKSRVSDLESLLRPENEPEPEFRWQDIAKEDGWDAEPDLWKSINYADSSDEEVLEDATSDASETSEETSLLSPEKYHRTAKALITPPGDSALLYRVETNQHWRYTAHRDRNGRSKKTPISEYQVVREVIFMLGGLDTSIFDSKCDPVWQYQLADVSWDTHKALISSVAEYGRSLRPLRNFVLDRQQIPLLQVFQNSVQKALGSLDAQLANIQARFMEIVEDVVVSLNGIMAELRPTLRPLFALASIVRQLDGEPHAHAFRYLELLFDAAATAQLEGSDASYELLGSIFFECFQVYLRPIRLWMEEGKLVPGERTFFVSDSAETVPLPRIWEDQFKLLKTSEGALHAPRFLQPAVHRIFTTGKSVVVLKHLGHFGADRTQSAIREPEMSFALVCAQHPEFAPFSEVFDRAFNAWIRSKHHTASVTLRELLFESYGLSSGLEALHSIYLMSDGSVANAFASAIFRHLDGLSASWKDRFTLTELAQEAFSSAVDAYRLSAQVDPKGVVNSAIASRASVRVSIPGIRLVYRLNWPLQVIVPDKAMQSYHAVFVLLLQIRRAIFVLQRRRFTGSKVDEVNTPQQATYYLLRAKLLWFCNNLLTYLSSLVLAPNIAEVREALLRAVDVDAMIRVHSAFVEKTMSECCLGLKLGPIRECILDILDLTIRLEDAQQTAELKLAEEEQEITRLSVISSPPKLHAKRRTKTPVDNREDDDGDLDTGLEDILRHGGRDSQRPPAQVLREIDSEFETHLRFVTGGLKGVARASRDSAAAKWDLLAEMLETGIRQGR